MKITNQIEALLQQGSLTLDTREEAERVRHYAELQLPGATHWDGVALWQARRIEIEGTTLRIVDIDPKDWRIVSLS